MNTSLETLTCFEFPNAETAVVKEPLLEEIEAACEQACQSIAPAWPLDRAIAVNPHWCRIGRPVREVAARMAVLGDIRVFPSRSYVQQAWREGRIKPQDLHYALSVLPAAQAQALSAAQCIDALSTTANVSRLPLLIDVLDNDLARHTRLSWRQAITHQVSQTCASYFDENQADWQPARGAGLYAFWRDTLTHDHGIGVLMGVPDLGKWLNALPATRQDAERWALQRLGLPEPVWGDYL
ncbi:MAG: putative inorganic carbon transporter subunit DabA, partial [Rhodoferax sp.]